MQRHPKLGVTGLVQAMAKPPPASAAIAGAIWPFIVVGTRRSRTYRSARPRLWPSATVRYDRIWRPALTPRRQCGPDDGPIEFPGMDRP